MTVGELSRIMHGNLQAQGSPSMAYGPQYMTVKLIEQFVDDIIIADANGKSDVVTLRTSAKNILRTFYKMPKSSDPELEKQRIIPAAAELKSTVTFLPMATTNMSCIYSTLAFVAEQAMRQGMTPIVTFDQPLWWKAQSIVHSDTPDDATKSNVLKLRMFHTQMRLMSHTSQLACHVSSVLINRAVLTQRSLSDLTLDRSKVMSDKVCLNTLNRIAKPKKRRLGRADNGSTRLISLCERCSFLTSIPDGSTETIATRSKVYPV